MFINFLKWNVGNRLSGHFQFVCLINLDGFVETFLKYVHVLRSVQY